MSAIIRFRTLVVAVVCLIIAGVVGLYSIGTGDYPIDPVDVLRTITGAGSPSDAFVVNELRLPRVVTALLVGGALGLSGAIFTSIVRNPLGSPDVLGFTQGASTGALMLIAFAGGSGLAFGAIGGGVLTGTLIYLLAWQRGIHGYRLVLTGIGIGAILTGVNGYLLTRMQVFDVAQAVLWLTGSLDGRAWHDAIPLLITMIVVVPPTIVFGTRALDTLELGDDLAASLGLRVERARLVLLAVAVTLTALAAAAAGPIVFVALAAPQLARRLTRATGPNLLPALCMGAALLVVADWLAQRVIPGHQLPVGVVTGLIGGAYLVWLLATERRRGRI